MLDTPMLGPANLVATLFSASKNLSPDLNNLQSTHFYNREKIETISTRKDNSFLIFIGNTEAKTQPSN